MKLKFGKVRGQHRLSQDKEQAMADNGEEWVSAELAKELGRIASMSATDVFTYGVTVVRLNSLIWIYVQMAGERLKRNIAILMAYSSGRVSINALAAAARLNPSFVGRMINLEETGLGGWNYQNLFLLAGTLKVGPASLLFADFNAAVASEAARFPQ